MTTNLGNQLLAEALARPNAEIFQIKRVPNHPKANTWAVTVDFGFDNSSTYYVQLNEDALEGNISELLERGKSE